MATIYTDTDVIGRAVELAGGAQQMLAGGASREDVNTELQRLHELLLDMVDRAVDAAAERSRRETEWQQTGAFTFSSAP